MKLAEALVLRGDIQKRQAQLSARIKRNTLVQEGERPAEDPNALLSQYEESALELRTLICAINHTNAHTPFESGTMTDALAERDRLRTLVTVVQDIASAATVTRAAQTRSEIRFVPTMNVAALQKKADKLSRELRDLDVKIQSANWTVDLMTL